MSYKITALLQALLIIFCLTAAGGRAVLAQNGGEAKTVSLDQICELYLDYPMTADEMYHDKTVKTTVEVSVVRKIPLLCAGFPEGSFTMEIVTKHGPVLECYCNPPALVSTLENTPQGSSLTVTGIYKSMSGSFSQSDSEEEQCKVTMHDCSLK
ncbi:MAG TPA: hypothetical protein VLG45_06330 [Thermodesulfobacteriota bacterium]|nr:hypothetical protein [Thermodesulfobacteriota bacterium]